MHLCPKRRAYGVPARHTQRVGNLGEGLARIADGLEGQGLQNADVDHIGPHVHSPQRLHGDGQAVAGGIGSTMDN